MGDLFQDLRFGMRVLRRTPLLTLAAVASLALGIGANTAIFTAVKEVFLEPLPVAEPDSLLAVFRTLDAESAGAGAGAGLLPTSFANFEDLERRASTFAEMSALTFGQFNLAGDGEPEVVAGGFVTPDHFDVLGLEPAAGRFFDEGDATSPVAVISHGLWSRRFAESPDVVGATTRVNGRDVTVVGVAPSGFHGMFTLADEEMWLPVRLYPEMVSDPAAGQFLTHRGWRMFAVYGRLDDGVSLAAADDQLERIGRELAAEHPEWNRGRGFELLPVAQSTLDPNQRDLFNRAGTVMMLAVSLVLLIACANVANLLLARARGRQREIAMRLSLGADRLRLTRQLLTESLLLAALGGAAGLLVAVWLAPLLWRLRPPFLGGDALDLGLDPTVLAFTALLSLATGLLFGLVPVRQAMRTDLVRATRESAGASGPGGRGWLGSGLVAAQVALCFVALTAAALFLFSLRNALAIDPGFDAERLLIGSLDWNGSSYDVDEARSHLDRLLEELSALPGVEAAAAASSAPLGFSPSFRILPVGAGDRVPPEGVYIALAAVTPDYFRALGVELVEGRWIEPRDRADAEPVVVVNRTLAERYWPGESAVDHELRWPGADRPWRIVGVVEDLKYQGLGEDPRPYFYRPLAQEWRPALTLHLRARDPAALLPALERTVRRLEPELPLVDAMAVDRTVRRSLWAASLGAGLLGAFGALALLLAAIGIYGVVTQRVQESRREVGIRMALGAGGRDVLARVVMRGMRPVAIGLLIGVAAAVAASRLLRGLLYELSGAEPGILALTAALLALVGLAACAIPATRALRLDPTKVLRAD